MWVKNGEKELTFIKNTILQKRQTLVPYIKDIATELAQKKADMQVF